MESVPFKYVSDAERSVIDGWWDVITDAEGMITNPLAYSSSDFDDMMTMLYFVSAEMRRWGYDDAEPRDLIMAIDDLYLDKVIDFD